MTLYVDPLSGALIEEDQLSQPPVRRPRERCFLGLDLGQVSDYTALVIIRRTLPPGWDPERIFPDPPPGCRYELVGLKQYPLGTPYLAIVSHVASLLVREPLRLPGDPPLDRPSPRRRSTLVIDATGVGPAVVDMFRQARLDPVAVTITAGHQAAQTDHNDWRVPKRDLVSVLQALLQAQRLEIAADLPETAVLYRELKNFRVRITLAAHETFGAWREREHDDTVLALALACWAGETALSNYVWVY
jgi:hypothetical protein